MTEQSGPPQMIDGKYSVLRELSREGQLTLFEVSAAEGVTRQVAWFDVTTPTDRQAFHTYRTALRTLAPAGLTDVVARPGAFYAVWQPVAGLPLEDMLAQPVKHEQAVEAVRALAGRLAAHGYALGDADIVVEDREPRVAYLRPAARTPEEIAALNAPHLAALTGGRVKRQRRRQPGAWLTFVPGLLFLGGAAYYGAQAAQIYLNPPVREVVKVTGEEAQDAARKLTRAGFRVEYAEGQTSTLDIGKIMRQDPAPGKNLPVGRLVILTVNNPPSIGVPRVEELTVNQAKAALKDGTLVLGKVVNVDGTLTNTAKGHVIAQVPQPGAQTQPGQPVQVMVSTGVRGKDTMIPLLEGMTAEQAREWVRGAGLVVTKWTEQQSDKPENTVLAQTPAPYERVPVGSPVTLTIAVARSSPPTQSAGNLPLPPPYVPPPPPEPVTPDPATDPAANPDAVTPGTPDPASPGTETPGTPTPSGEPPAEPVTPPTTPEADEAQTVSFNYEFPADLPDGTYTVIVRDQDSEREVLAPTDAAQLRGAAANSDQAITVRGDAVFVIRRDGADYVTLYP